MGVDHSEPLPTDRENLGGQRPPTAPSGIPKYATPLNQPRQHTATSPEEGRAARGGPPHDRQMRSSQRNLCTAG